MGENWAERIEQALDVVSAREVDDLAVRAADEVARVLTSRQFAG